VNGDSLARNVTPKVLLVAVPMRLGFVAVLAAAVWLAASDPEPLFGEGLCGITQTFAHYQGRMISQQTTPAWMPADTPAAWAYASVDVMFTPHYLKVTITGGGDSPETLSCLFECAISKQVEHFSGVTLLALNSSTVLNGTTSPSLFGCLPPNETAHGSSSQILTALLANNCGNASTATGLNGTNIFELTFKPYYSNQAATPASNWIENITFMSSPTGEFNTYNCTNPKCVNQSFNGISWLQCPYDINGEQGTAFLDVILSMRPVSDAGLLCQSALLWFSVVFRFLVNLIVVVVCMCLLVCSTRIRRGV
jgi:hypothetical protein